MKNFLAHKLSLGRKISVVLDEWKSISNLRFIGSVKKIFKILYKLILELFLTSKFVQGLLIVIDNIMCCLGMVMCDISATSENILSTC